MAGEGKVGAAVAEEATPIAARIAKYLAGKGADIPESHVADFADQVAARLESQGGSAAELAGADDAKLASKIQGLFPEAAPAKQLGAGGTPPPTQATPSPSEVSSGGEGAGGGLSLAKKTALGAGAAGAVAGGAYLYNREPSAVAAEPPVLPPVETAPPPPGALPPGLGRDLTLAPAFVANVGALDLSKVGKAPTVAEYGLTAKQVEPQDQSTAVLKQALDEHRGVMNSLVAEYKAAKSDIDRRELWEGIVQGLALMASGLYGLRNNVDMSGVKLSPTDWEDKRKLELAQLREFSDQADKQFGNSKDYATSLHQQAKEEGDRLDKDWAQNAKLYEAAARAYNEKVGETAKVWETKYQDAHLQNDVAYKKAELSLQSAKLEDMAKRTENQAQKAQLLQRAKTSDQAAKMLTNFNAGMARAAGEKSSDERKAWAPALQQQAEDIKRLTGSYPPGVTPNMFVTQGGFFSGPGSADVRDVAEQRGKTLAAPPSAAAVRMTDPTGKSYLVPADKADAARQQGWK